MMRYLIITVFSIISISTLPSFAKSVSAVDQSCEFMDALLLNNKKGTEVLKKIFVLIEENKFKPIAATLETIRNDHKYFSGSVWEISNLDGLLVEHLILMNTKSRGNIFFRIVYEKFANDMKGIKVFINTDMETTWKEWPFLQTPKRTHCQ